MTTQHVSPPTGSRRLLELLSADGGSVGLREHADRYGSLLLRGYRGPQAPHPLIDSVARADLRGRGGAGFPLAVKMRAVARRSSGRAVVVANGAESEPLSAKDALLVSRLPHLVIDGAVLAADSIGASTAHIVVHDELAYAGAARALAERVDPVEVRLHRAPDGYVAGQETSLIAWLNGGKPLPTFTPPLPAHRGVGGRPTLLSNVETLAHLALVGRFGADWYRSVGSGTVHGTTLLTLAGAVATPGVVEAEFGTSIADVLRRGCPDERADAVLIGGWFGGWVTLAQAATLTVDPEAVSAAGTGLGAGVIFVLPPEDCGLRYTADVARWLAAASAGQCGPCINGLPAIASAMDDLSHGRRVDAALTNLDRWTHLVPDRGACRHPDGTARFVGTALRVFAADIRAHRDGHCRRLRRAAS